MRFKVRQAWSNPCWPGIAEAASGMTLEPELFSSFPSLPLLHASKSSDEAPLDCDAFVDSDAVVGAALVSAVIV